MTLLAGCKGEGVVGPLQPVPGRRDYIWTVDTIRAPYNLFKKFGGTSASDLWAINSGDGDKTIFRFNGSMWRTDGVSRPVVPNSIYSLSPSDAWIGGNDGRLWHYDGSSWSENYKYPVDSATLFFITGISGIATNNLYAVGYIMKSQFEYEATILHYDGSVWRRVPIFSLHTGFVNISLDRSGTGKFFLVGYTDEQSRYQLYEFNGSTLSTIKEGTYANDELGNTLELREKVDFIIGHDLFAYANGSFAKVAHLTDSPLFLNGGCGRSESDVFLAMLDGIAHYNGSDTQYLVQFQTKVRLIDSKVFDKDVFFMGWDEATGYSLIFHGKRKV